MNRAYTLQFCEKCTKRGFSPKTGIICSLTEAPADFETTCLTFEEDEKEAKRIELLKHESTQSVASDETYGMSKIGIANPTVAGIVLMFLATAWFIVGMMFMDRIFFYPPVLFIFGVISLVKGQLNGKASPRKIKNDDSLLDDL